MTFLRDIVFTALLCGIITGLTSLGKSGTNRYVKYVSSLIFLCVLLSPFIKETTDSVSFIEQVKNIGYSESNSTTDSNNNESYAEIVAKEICRTATIKAAEEFKVPADSFSLSITFEKSDLDEYSIKEAKVYVSEKGGTIDKSKLIGYFKELLNCNIEVIVNE